MIPVLAHSVENLTDARYFASWMVDWISLTAERGGHEVLNMTSIKEIASWLDGSQMIVSFDRTPLEEALWFTREAGLGALMLPYQPVGDNIDVDIFFTIDLDEPNSGEMINTALRNGAHVVIRASAYNPEVADRLSDLLPTPFLRKKAFLDMPLDVDMVRDLDESMPGIGFCLAGSQEEKLGVKSFEDLDEIVETLRPWD